MTNYEYNGYGCPETEMWMLRAKFESEVCEESFDLTMRMDAPHYNSRKTRIAYFEWEKEQ